MPNDLLLQARRFSERVHDQGDAIIDFANDPEGRKWVTATLDDQHGQTLVEGCLLTLIAEGADGSPAIVGNAFIIYANSNAALCLTAAHNFEYIKALQK
jgi:hypothetical protein